MINIPIVILIVTYS